MGEQDQLAMLRALAGLQAVRAELAAAELRGAEAALLAAEEVTRRSELRRSSALERWQQGLSGRDPDPRHLARAGDWLVEQEHALKAFELDEAIAGRHRDAMARSCAEGMAQRDVAEALRDRLRRSRERRREERRTLAAAELHMARRRR